MKLLVDMNLSPQWCETLRIAGFDATHWSEVGDPRATDSELIGWASRQGWVILTNDLDFGAILASTKAHGPSVVQIRTQRLMPADLGDTVVHLLLQHQRDLEQGALLVLDDATSRVRILPFNSA